MLNQSIDTEPAVDSVPLKYYLKLLRELRRDGQVKSMKLMMEGAWFSDTRAWWIREAL